MTEDTQLMFLWVAYAILATGAFVAVLVWGFRAGQFRDARRAAGLALRSEIPNDKDEGRRMKEEA